MKRYFLNIPDEPSPMMDFGKQFATDIEDYAKGEEREFNFPPNFLENIKLYPRVEHKLVHNFEDFTFIGYIDNASDNFEIIRDFKTGTAAWTQDRLENSLQMQAYCYVIFMQYGIIPTCFIDYYKTRLKGKEMVWTDVHETYQHTFTMQDIAKVEIRIKRAAEQIAEAYALHCNKELESLMKMYVDCDYLIKIKTEERDKYRKKIEDTLQNERYMTKVEDKILSYSTYQRKSYIYSSELQEREEQLAAQKKQEIEYGVAKEETKTVTLLTVKDIK
jgi:DNA-binding Lrp family transcriptional regulator